MNVVIDQVIAILQILTFGDIVRPDENVNLSGSPELLFLEIGEKVSAMIESHNVYGALFWLSLPVTLPQ